MDTRHKYISILLACTMILTASAIRANGQDGPSTTVANYLNLPSSAASASLGEVGVSLTGDLAGWILNPATLHALDGSGFGVFHSEWILDTRYNTISAYNRISERIVLASGAMFTYRPTIDGYDEFGTATSELKSYNYQGLIGLGANLHRSFALGLNLKYFGERLADWKTSGMAADIGALYTISKPNITLGAALRNLGPDISFETIKEPIPMTVMFGGTLTVPVNTYTSVRVIAEGVKPRYEDMYVGAGMELTFYDILSTRVGYCGQDSRPGSGLTGGLGFLLKGKIRFDYSYTQMGDLGSFHKASIFFVSL